MSAMRFGLAVVALVGLLPPAEAVAQTPCLRLPANSPWPADRASTIELIDSGRAAIGAEGIAALVVTQRAGTNGSGMRRMMRRFPQSGTLRLRLDPGSYEASLARLQPIAGGVGPQTIDGCKVEPFSVVPSTGPWTPSPQAWLTGGALFADVGVEAIEILGKWGIAGSATVRREAGAARWEGSAVARRSATRGYFDLGVRRADSGSWDRPQLGLGLEMPPFRGHPFWITVALVATESSLQSVDDWDLWRPRQWAVRRSDWDLFFGFRFDLRRVQR